MRIAVGGENEHQRKHSENQPSNIIKQGSLETTLHVVVSLGTDSRLINIHKCHPDFQYSNSKMKSGARVRVRDFIPIRTTLPTQYHLTYGSVPVDSLKHCPLGRIFFVSHEYEYWVHSHCIFEHVSSKIWPRAALIKNHVMDVAIASEDE